MFGRTMAEAVRHSYSDLIKPGVRFVQATIRSIDPVRRRVETDAGAFEADVMVVALGADLDPAATSGLVEAGPVSSTPSTAPSPAATCWTRSVADG
jgi:sulfide:quinone oxidoreductase